MRLGTPKDTSPVVTRQDPSTIIMVYSSLLKETNDTFSWRSGLWQTGENP